MTPHVRSRLSAYLDGELPAAERAAVDRHLRMCAECSRRLEQLSTLDATARALPVVAPAGYFEDLPARVRSRLTASPRARAWRPPIWSWALAAALLLAVVTPVTLLRREAPVVEKPRRESVPSPVPAAERDDRLEALRDQGYFLHDRAAQAPPLKAPAAPPVTIADARTQPGRAGGRKQEREPQPGVAAKAPDTEAPPNAFAPEPVAPPPMTPAERPNEDADRSTAAEQTATEPKSLRLDGRRREDIRAPVPALPRPQKAASAESRYAGLLASGVPGSAAEARAIRDGWRAFVRDFPAAPQADEARVRAIEAGLDLYRRSGDPDDLEAARADAADYLARTDAAQSERVRALLEALER